MTEQKHLGYTDLLDQQDIPKYDLRVDTLGTLDEASSALGVVRATISDEQLESIILTIQRDLCWMMSELATVAEEAEREIHITPERVIWLAKILAEFGAEADPAQDSSGNNYIQLARTVVARAERMALMLQQREMLYNSQIATYLNQLSAFLSVLAGR